MVNVFQYVSFAQTLT